MKRAMYLLISAAFALAFGACNQHSWDEAKGEQPPTKDLFNHGHGAHDEKGHDEHEGDVHAGDKEHEGEKKEEKPN